MASRSATSIVREPRRRLLPLSPMANGSSTTEIPADRGSIGVFSTLDDISSKRTSGIIEEAAKSEAKAGSNTRKIADLYNSYMNEQAIEDRRAWHRSNRSSRQSANQGQASVGASPGRDSPRRCRSAEQHQLPYCRISSDSGSRRAFMTPLTTPPICCRAALHFRTANITSPAATACARSAPSIRRTWPRC